MSTDDRLARLMAYRGTDAQKATALHFLTGWLDSGTGNKPITRAEFADALEATLRYAEIAIALDSRDGGANDDSS